MTIASSFVTSADGVRIARQVAGVASGPAVVFVHGFAQSGAIWRSVLEGPLARDHLLVSFDLRGHGDSGRPEVERAAGAWLGGDLTAVIASLNAPAPPVVVAWSYGGAVLGAYLRAGGSLGGALLVAAAVKIGRAARPLFGSTMLDHARALLSDDAAVYAEACRRFLGACTATPLPGDAFEAAVSEMRRVAAPVRRAMLARDDDYGAELAACAAPLATLHGRADTVVLPAMSEHIAATVPGVDGTWLDRIGHVPWLEAPSAFESAVRRLVRIPG